MPYPIIINIKDEEGDLIPGSTELYGIKNTIVGYAFKHHVSIHLDYDASTNEEIKLIKHNPFYFVKEVDKSSPVLNQYLVTQDELKEVEFLYFMHDGSGFEKEYYNIRLENVIITKIKVFLKMAFLEKNEPYRLMEQVGLSYKKAIWWEHKSGSSSIMAMHEVPEIVEEPLPSGDPLFDKNLVRLKKNHPNTDIDLLRGIAKSDTADDKLWEETFKPKPFIELQYQYTDGEPLALPYRVTFEGGRVYKGNLDKNGYKKLESVPDELCEIIYGDQDKFDELLPLKNELKKTLDDMVAEVRTESRILEKTLQEYGYLSQGMILTGAFLTGLYDAGKDTVGGIYDVGEFAYGSMVSVSDEYAEIKRSIHDAVKSDNLDEVRKKIGALEAQGEAALNTVQETYETCELVLGDNHMRTMITGFAGNYFKNLHSTQKAEMLGSLSLDIVITLLTSGAGTAASFISKSRHFSKATGLISNITVVLKKRKQLKKFDGTLNKINPKKLKRKEIAKVDTHKPVKKKKDDEETTKCGWKKCKGEHKGTKKKVQDRLYPKRKKGSITKGKASSGKDYEKEWISKGLEPWKLYGPGIDSQATKEDYKYNFNDLASERNINAIDKSFETKYPAYVTQKHHVISVHLFDKFKTLSNNAKLVGYNVNNKENGICLPMYAIDIVQHDLQCHNGSHPARYSRVLKMFLDDLEEDSKKYCIKKKQKKLKKELNEISERTIEGIKGWKKNYFVRSSALKDKKWAEEQKKKRRGIKTCILY